MTVQELDNLLQELKALPKECEWVEFKIDNSNPQEIGEYLSALSNSSCYCKQSYGYLVFGIEDVTHNLVGTHFYPSKEKKGNQELENWLAVQLNPRIDFNIYEFNFEQLHFVIFRVQATQNTPVNFRGEPFIRVGSYKKKLDDHPEKERQIWNKEIDYIFERDIAQVNLNEEKIIQLIDYPAYFDLINMPLPDNRKGIIERLIIDKVITKQQSEYSITNIGALLFAKDINAFETLSRKAVRVIIYEGNNRIKTKLNNRV